MKRALWLLVLSPLLAGGCGSDSNDKTDATIVADGGVGGTDGAASDGAVTSALTYWQDVAPIVNDKCVKCHQTGGIGPFSLDGYANMKANAAGAVSVVGMGIMPPYLVTHDGTCGSFEDGETLTDAQKQTIIGWAQGGQAEGTPVTLTTPAKPTLASDSEWKTPTLTPVAQGGTLAQYDEYRCFPLDSSNITKDSYITGYDVEPGNPAIVHHVLAFLVDPTKVTANGKTNAEVMAALDAQDPDRVGWPCFGLAGDGVELDSVPVIWAPGQGPVTYPGGLGVPHHPGQKLIVQIHYNLADPRLQGMSDSTTVRFKHADTVDRHAVFVLKDGLLDTLGTKTPASLPPGQKSVKYTWNTTVEQMGLDPQIPYLDLVGVMPHMHQRGVSKTMTIQNPGATKTCEAQVDRWDFNWQKFYFYKAPPRVTAASTFELTCDYDTSKETAPVLPGWGTRNEMCIAILMFALPPGL